MRWPAARDGVMRVDVQGDATVRSLCPQALLIFLTTSNEPELERRLRARHTETADELTLRLATARQEMKRLPEFDYVVVNRDNHLDEAVTTILAIMEADNARVHDIAGRLLRETMDGVPLVQAEFDELVAASSRLRLELDSLRHEVQDILRSSEASSVPPNRSSSGSHDA